MILRHVTIDCAEPFELATFWSEVTGWAVSDEAVPGDSEMARVIALGAKLYEDHRTADGRGWVTLLDPEGNEFCIERG